MSLCVMCSQGMTAMCLGSGCTPQEVVNDVPNPETTTESTSDEDNQISDTRTSALGRTAAGRNKRRGTKRDAALKDHQSTGRKRAARAYPLNRSEPCEWQGNSNCGGGLRPIIGCVDGLQQARHHGPDKTVTNNDEGNVHRICHACHNRWHTANDKDYDWSISATYPPHKPVAMSAEDRKYAVLLHLQFMATKPKPVKD